jgi:hypothetical protein
MNPVYARNETLGCNSVILGGNVGSSCREQNVINFSKVIFSFNKQFKTKFAHTKNSFLPHSTQGIQYKTMSAEEFLLHIPLAIHTVIVASQHYMRHILILLKQMI